MKFTPGVLWRCHVGQIRGVDLGQDFENLFPEEIVTVEPAYLSSDSIPVNSSTTVVNRTASTLGRRYPKRMNIRPPERFSDFI